MNTIIQSVINNKDQVDKLKQLLSSVNESNLSGMSFIKQRKRKQGKVFSDCEDFWASHENSGR